MKCDITSSDGPIELVDLLADIELGDFGVITGWIDDRQIFFIRTDGDMKREAVDGWADTLITIVDSWSDKQPIAVLQNLSHPNQGFTPYSKARTTDIFNAVPKNRVAYCAVVMQETFVNRIIGFFLNSIRNRDGMTIRIFTDCEEALTWLRIQLNENDQIFL